MLQSKKDKQISWQDAINQESLEALNQAWGNAIKILIQDYSAEKGSGGNGVIRLTYQSTFSSWVTQGEYISVLQNQGEKTLFEGRIQWHLGQTIEVRVQEDMLASIIMLDSFYYILPYSSLPYRRTQEILDTVMLLGDSVSYDLLTKDKTVTSAIKAYQGPPGTGKTTYIGRLCQRFYVNNSTGDLKILLSAFTHRACINLVEELTRRDIPFLTIRIQGLSKEFREEHDLDTIVRRKMKMYQQQYSQANTLTKEEFSDWKNSIIQETMEDFDFHICTAMTAPSRYPTSINPWFDLIFIDEASQIILPILAGGLALARHGRIFGDPAQLPPVILSEIKKDGKSQKNPLSTSIYQKLDKKSVKLLTKQYRGRPEFFWLVSALFYTGKLQTGHFIDTLDIPVLKLIDTGSIGKDIHRKNQVEAQVCKSTVAEIVRAKMQSPTQEKLSIGILSPFAAQVSLLRQVINVKKYSGANLEIGTIHTMQGRTYDIVLFSLSSTSFSPFLNPPFEFIQDLNKNLDVNFTQMKHNQVIAKEQGYPDFTKQLKQVKKSWSHVLKEYSQIKNKSKDETTLQEKSGNFNTSFKSQRRENESAPNLFNVALSRAKHSLIIVGSFEKLLDNPLLSLIYNWAKYFGTIDNEDSI